MNTQNSRSARSPQVCKGHLKLEVLRARCSVSAHVKPSRQQHHQHHRTLGRPSADDVPAHTQRPAWLAGQITRGWQALVADDEEVNPRSRWSRAATGAALYAAADIVAQVCLIPTSDRAGMVQQMIASILSQVPRTGSIQDGNAHWDNRMHACCDQAVALRPH